MSEDKRCALIRQTWYESAKKNLKQEERLAFYEACFDFEFYGHELDREKCPFSSVMLLFDMVRYNIISDRDKADRIAERNRRNGMQGGRPRRETQADNLETQENPKNPSGYSGLPLHYTTQHNTTPHKKKPSLSFSILHTDEQKYENFYFLFIFFARGVVDPIGERERFMDYYKARGWCVAKDVPATDKIALCKSWKSKDTSEVLIQARAPWVKILQAIDAEDDVLITQFVAFNPGANAWDLTLAGRESYDLLEGKYLRGLYNVTPWANEEQTQKIPVNYKLPA